MMYQILPKFVDEIPDKIGEGYLYLCLPYNAVIHKCPCGCGEIISTPLDKKYGWIMQYDGETVSLSPSIGNGFYKCRSHYFIRENKIVWLEKIKETEIKDPKKKVTNFIKSFIKEWLFQKLKKEGSNNQ